MCVWAKVFVAGNTDYTYVLEHIDTHLKSGPPTFIARHNQVCVDSLVLPTVVELLEVVLGMTQSPLH